MTERRLVVDFYAVCAESTRVNRFHGTDHTHTHTHTHTFMMTSDKNFIPFQNSYVDIHYQFCTAEWN